jgi:hypothetical protein
MITTTVYAPSPIMQLPAVDSIKASYDMDTLREIAEHGCESGIAHDHIYSHQTWDFFLIYEDDIEDYFFNMLGDEWMSELGFMDSRSVRQYVNNLVWSYVECIANQIVEGNN